MKTQTESEEKKKKTSKAKKKVEKRKVKKIAFARGKRKEAIARAVITDGNGKFIINGKSINSIQNNYIKEIIMEPLRLAAIPLEKINIRVNVVGGGVMGQAQAIRTAVARALVNYTEDEKIKSLFNEYDKFILVEDSRRVEPKKYKGRKARARFQKSYR